MENVKSLCSIGHSTKKHQENFIGQKGLGFKSVFKVTDAPQVHSRGFHFSFDLRRDPQKGYFMPEWLEANTSGPMQVGRVLNKDTAATQLILPLKQVTAKPC